MNRYMYVGFALIVAILVASTPGDSGIPRLCLTVHASDLLAVQVSSEIARQNTSTSYLQREFIPAGPALSQSCNGQIRSYEASVAIYASRGLVGSTAEVVIQVNPERFIFTTAGAYAVYNVYYGYYNLVGIGAILATLTSQQDSDGWCSCEGWEIVRQRWSQEDGASPPYIVFEGWGDSSQDYVEVIIDPYYVEYKKVVNLCPDPKGEIVIGGVSIIVNKSHYEGPPR